MADKLVIDGIVLAAGASSRMGQPKALLEVDGQPFLERAIQLLRHAGCRYVVVVVNDADDWITRLADATGGEPIINDQQRSEQIDSLRLGIANLPDGYDAIIVLPVDFPRVQQETVNALVAQFRKQPVPVLNPAFDGKPGHPVIFSRDVVAELLRPDLPEGARTVIDRHIAEAKTLEVNDAGVLIDIDTPADFREHVEGGAR
jgi:molybdenum cofactor cytidylyltransferase